MVSEWDCNLTYTADLAVRNGRRRTPSSLETSRLLLSKSVTFRSGP
jgi:hypothetical protein